MNEQSQIQTPEQALSILEQATANVQATRKDHMLIIEAIKLLNTYVSSPAQSVSSTIG